MAINIKKTAEKIELELDNGHSTALEKIAKDYGLKGEKEAMSFMLSVISEADGQPIRNGKGSFLPSENLTQENASEKS